MKHGFVLMVMDHHPTDHTVNSGPHLFCVCVELWLLGHHSSAGHRMSVFKDLRRGWNIWDRGESVSKETRRCTGSLLGGHCMRLLSLLCLVWIKSWCVALFSPSGCFCIVVSKLQRVPLWVSVIIPASITHHLKGITCLCVTSTTWG